MLLTDNKSESEYCQSSILSKPENVIKTCYKYFTDNNLGIKNYVRIKYLELQCSKYKGWSLVNEHTKMLHDQFKLSMADLWHSESHKTASQCFTVLKEYACFKAEFTQSIYVYVLLERHVRQTMC